MMTGDEGSKTIVNISSQWGSIENTNSGAGAVYRISKAANNMSLKLFAEELGPQGFRCLAIHPGHVATDMGSSGGRQAPMQPEESIGKILQFVASKKG